MPGTKASSPVQPKEELGAKLMVGAVVVGGLLLSLGLVYLGIRLVDNSQKNVSRLKEVSAIEAEREKVKVARVQQERREQEAEDEKRRTKLRNYLSLTICEGNDQVAGELAAALESVRKETNDAFVAGTLPADVPSFMEQRLLKRLAENTVLRQWFGSRSPAQFAHAIYGTRQRSGPSGGEGAVPDFLASDKYVSMGSGFFISRDGWILTNQHVVHSDSEVDVRISSGEIRTAKVIKSDAREDIAVLKMDGVTVGSSLSLDTDDAVMGAGVFTIGFPKPSIQGVEPKFTDGRISSLTGIRDDKHTYQISVPVQPGNSGGPLVSSKSGLVAGMISSKLASDSTDSAPENVNYAIKESVIRTFLKSVASLDLKPNADAAGSNGDEDGIIKNVKSSVVLVLRRRG